MTRKIGFIGCGNMAMAMIGGIVRSRFASGNEIIASNRTRENLEKMQQAFKIEITQDNKMVAQQSDFLFLSVKPEVYETVIEEIKDIIKEDSIIIMIAGGQTIARNELRFGRKVKLVRAMPNTPILVGEGMTAFSVNSEITEKEKDELISLFEAFGRTELVEESMIDAVSGVSGSSPAYAFLFIEALADGAVLHGLPRKQAYMLASQALLGAAKMVLETGMHPGELKDHVCSPGGSTIKAVAALEENGFRSAVIKGLGAAISKAKKMDE
ncbi:pyrroline-5-carboxylate reductase [Bacillus massilinigeriensis]|uniref:pyrroline-5-carboxylate reductase n=1 Tax=Bacillus mediterraneensis TaxID=1805474 RepID=UPI0008F8FF7F|nr:pyrroline-5-carboxylate reductase [Bacillus mediterraneensis]